MIKLYGCIYILFLYSTVSYTQNDPYSKARNLALNTQYEAAIRICDSILKDHPKNTDALNLLGWMESQLHNYPNATVHYEKVLSIDTYNYDALSGIINVLNWDQQFENSNKYANKALGHFAKDKNLVWLKIQSLMGLNELTEAVNYIDQLLSIDPNNSKAIQLRKEIKNEAKTHQISVAYSKETYQDFYSPLQLTQLGYQSSMSWGTLGINAQHAQRNNASGYLFDLESYPRFWKGSYGYVNVAISNKKLFPHRRLSFDWNQSVFKTFGVGIGIRNLQFTNETINIYKLSVEKYLGKFRFEGVVYRGPSSQGFTYTYLWNVRRYLNKSTDYLFVTLGNAFSPDVQGRIDESGAIYKVKSKQIILGFQANLSHKLQAFTQLTFMNNELPFQLGAYVDGQILNGGLRMLF